MNCPQGFETPYVMGREGCTECTIKECLLPSVNHEIGEWYPYWLDEVVGWKSKYIVSLDELKKVAYQELGEILDRGFKTAHSKYGKRIVQDIANRCGIGSTTLYKAHKFYLKYPDLKEKKFDDSLTWSQECKLIDAKGDVKVLSQEHEHDWVKVEVCKVCGVRKKQKIRKGER